MATVNEIYSALDSIAPFDSQLSFDHAGFLVGDGEQEVKKALLALDVTSEVINEAMELGCQLIISHHPIIWNPLPKLMSNSRAYRLAHNGLSVISAHTNLDKADNGVNDCLAQAIGLLNCRRTTCPENNDIGTCGELPEPLTARELAIRVRDALGCESVQYTRGSGMIKTVTVIGGGGGSFVLDTLKCEADAVVTGEADHAEVIDVAEEGKTVILAGHFQTEVVVFQKLAELLSERTEGTEFIISRTKAPLSSV